MKSVVHIAAIVIASALLCACGHPTAPQAAASGDSLAQYRDGLNQAEQLQTKLEIAAMQGQGPSALGSPASPEGSHFAVASTDATGDIIVKWTRGNLAGDVLMLRASHRTAGGQSCFRFDQAATTVPADIVGSQPAPGNC